MEQSGRSDFDFSRSANPEDIRNLASSDEKASELIIDARGTTKDVSTGEMTDKFGNRVEPQPSSQNEVDESMLRRETEFNPPIQQVVDSFEKGEPTGSFVTLKGEDKQESAKVTTEKLEEKKVEVSDFRKTLNELRNTYEPHSEVLNRESSSDEILDGLHKKEAPKKEEKSPKKESIDPKVLDSMKKLGEMNSLDQLTKRIPETNEAGDSGAIAPDSKVEDKVESEGKETDMQIVLREIHGKLENNIALDRSERVILQLMISNVVTIKTETSVDTSAPAIVKQQQATTTTGETEVETKSQSTTTTAQTQETQTEQTEKKGRFRDWLKRNKTRIAIIAGGLATGVTTGLAHVPYVAQGAMLLGAASGLSSRLLSYLYNKDLEKLKTTNDENERKILTEKMLGKEKKMKILGYVGTFLGGVAVGNFATNFIASRIPGGQTGATGTQETGGDTTTTSGTEAGTTDTSTPVETTQTAPANTSTQVGTTPTETVTNVPIATPEVTGNGVLLSNGRVNLPGSAWNGNIAGNAVGNLQGGELNYSNYAGGWHEMAPKMLENDLISAGINRDTLLGNLSTADIHRLINGYLSDIQSGARGTTNPDLLTNLGKLGTEGAQNLISIIQGR